MSINDQRLAADIAACQSVPELQQQLRDRDMAIELLAAECCTLKNSYESQRKFILNGVEFGYIRLPDQPDPAIETYTQCSEGLEAPATAAFLNSVRAEGVERFAHQQRVIADATPDAPFQRHRRFAAGLAEDFAAQLRAGMHSRGKDHV